MSEAAAAMAPGTGRVAMPRGVVGFAAAVAATAALAAKGIDADGVVAAAFAVVLVVLSAIDLRERRIPNVIVLPATAVALVTQCALHPEDAPRWIGFSLLAGALLLVPAFVNPRGLGMGDVKLALLIGAVLGRGVIGALLLGFVLTLPVSAALFVRHGSAARRATLPLGPFLAAGALVVLFVSGRS